MSQLMFDILAYASTAFVLGFLTYGVVDTL
jgi:hypothetical protein